MLLLIAATLLLTLMLAAGCGGVSGARRPVAPAPPIEPPPVVTEAPVLSSEVTEPLPVRLYPPDTRAGIPVVDRVIELVAEQDRAALAALVKLTAVPCTASADNMDGLPACEPGVDSGTPVPALYAPSCQSHYLITPEEVRRAVGK